MRCESAQRLLKIAPGTSNEHHSLRALRDQMARTHNISADTNTIHIYIYKEKTRPPLDGVCVASHTFSSRIRDSETAISICDAVNNFPVTISFPPTDVLLRARLRVSNPVAPAGTRQLRRSRSVFRELLPHNTFSALSRFRGTSIPSTPSLTALIRSTHARARALRLFFSPSVNGKGARGEQWSRTDGVFPCSTRCVKGRTTSIHYEGASVCTGGMRE